MPITAAAIAITAAANTACPCQTPHADHGTPTQLIKPLCLLGVDAPIPFEQGAHKPLTPEQAAEIIANRGEPTKVIRSSNDGNRGPGGLTVIFNAFGPTNADTDAAMQFTADYYAATVLSPITVVFNVNFDPGNFGGASPFIEDVAYAAYRLALQNGADADDTIQNDIPSGDSFPARRSFGGSVSQESTLTLTTANLKALGLRPNDGSVDAELFIGTLPDGDPTDGIGNGLSGDFFGDFSLADILVHEVGHALGFINVIEFGLENPTSLDVHRFQRTGPDNPDTAAEFTNFPRALWTNQGPQSDRLHAFNFIDREHLASNAFDFQASHFEETGAFPDRIGIMEPAIAPFETGFPEYFSQADIDAFDAIGWDIVTESQCNAADLAPPFFTLDLADISAFVSGFTSADPVADLAAPFGTLDLADISVFVTAFSAGCP